jgi:hypothetical protein
MSIHDLTTFRLKQDEPPCLILGVFSQSQYVHKEALMTAIPPEVQTLFQRFSPAFTCATFQRWRVIALGAILTVGRRTVSNILRTVGTLAPGHPSSYHRIFSKRRGSLWTLGRTLAGYLLDHFVPEGPVELAGDDTVEEHRGKKVYGKGCHRDAVRSTRSFTAYRWGHRWVVLAILVKFSFSPRPWALPILMALYRPEALEQREGRRHKTCPDLMRQLLAVLIRWFPQRCFLFTGDSSYGRHELARFAFRHRQHLVLISRFIPNANLYELPPQAAAGRRGRRRVKGAKAPSPQAIVAGTQRRQTLWVRWYGGGKRHVEIVTAVGYWYKGGQGLVPVRWVFVHDLSGTHRDEYFFSTDPSMSAKRLISLYTGRWSIEVDFEEMRAYLGLETTRGWSEATVLRMAPCLFGLFSVVGLLYTLLPHDRTPTPAVQWVGKAHLTFSDVLTRVRRWLWVEWIFKQAPHPEAFSKLPRPLQEILLYGLAPAA